MTNDRTAEAAALFEPAIEKGKPVVDHLAALLRRNDVPELCDVVHRLTEDELATGLLVAVLRLHEASPPQPGTVRTAVQELRQLTSCRCDEAWTGRELHDPSCASEYREDVETIAAALAETEQ